MLHSVLLEHGHHHMVVVEIACLLDPNIVSLTISDLLDKWPQIHSLKFAAKDMSGNAEDGN